MSLSPFVSFQWQFVTYLLTFPRISIDERGAGWKNMIEGMDAKNYEMYCYSGPYDHFIEQRSKNY